jgi:hypothetical protein
MSLINLKMKKGKGENVEEDKMNIDIYVDMLGELVENNRDTIESSEEHETEEVYHNLNSSLQNIYSLKEMSYNSLRN